MPRPLVLVGLPASGKTIFTKTMQACYQPNESIRVFGEDRITERFQGTLDAHPNLKLLIVDECLRKKDFKYWVAVANQGIEIGHSINNTRFPQVIIETKKYKLVKKRELPYRYRVYNMSDRVKKIKYPGRFPPH